MAAAHPFGEFVRSRFKRIGCVRGIKVKFLKPGGDNLLHVGVCCKSLHGQLLLKRPKYYSLPKLPTYQKYSSCIHLVSFTMSSRVTGYHAMAGRLCTTLPTLPVWSNMVCVCTYRVIQEETSLIWEVIVSVFVRKEGHTNMCLILNGYRDGGV